MGGCLGEKSLQVRLFQKGAAALKKLCWSFSETEAAALKKLSGSLSQDNGRCIEEILLGSNQTQELHVDQLIQMKDISFICFLFNLIMN